MNNYYTRLTNFVPQQSHNQFPQTLEGNSVPQNSTRRAKGKSPATERLVRGPRQADAERAGKQEKQTQTPRNTREQTRKRCLRSGRLSAGQQPRPAALRAGAVPAAEQEPAGGSAATLPGARRRRARSCAASPRRARGHRPPRSLPPGALRRHVPARCPGSRCRLCPPQSLLRESRQHPPGAEPPRARRCGGAAAGGAAPPGSLAAPSRRRSRARRRGAGGGSAAPPPTSPALLRGSAGPGVPAPGPQAAPALWLLPPLTAPAAPASHRRAAAASVVGFLIPVLNKV